MRTSVIIPAFNEEGHIGDVLDNMPDVDEVIVIDDGSTDRTPEIVKEYNVTLLTNERKRGKGYSIRRGVSNSTGDFLIFIDGDFQFDPLEIRNFLPQRESELVLGVRNNIGGVRKITNKLSSIGIFLSTGKYFKDVLSGFRACKRAIWNDLNLESDGYIIDVEMVYRTIKKGFSIAETSVNAQYSEEQSHISVLDGLKISIFLVKKTVENLFNF